MIKLTKNLLLKSINFDSFEGIYAGLSSPLMACCGFGGPPYNYNINVTCGNPGSKACDAGSKFVSWDGIHYTEAANQIVASKVLSTAYSTPSTTFGFFCR